MKNIWICLICSQMIIRCSLKIASEFGNNISLPYQRHFPCFLYIGRLHNVGNNGLAGFIDVTDKQRMSQALHTSIPPLCILSAAVTFSCNEHVYSPNGIKNRQSQKNRDRQRIHVQLLYKITMIMIEQWQPGSIMYDFYSAAALLAMQSAVIPTAIPSVRPSVRPFVCLSVCHTLVPYLDEWT